MKHIYVIYDNNTILYTSRVAAAAVPNANNT